MVRSLLIMAFVIVVSSGLAACTNQTAPVDENDGAGIMESSPAVSEMVEPDELEMVEGDILEVTLDGGEFYFEPNMIEAKPGQTVTVRLTNTTGEMPHDFVIDELGVATDMVMPGEETTVTFTVPETAAGQSYEFYCSVGEHRANGMVGTLNVTAE